RTFRLLVECIVGICAIDDLSKEDERRVARKPVLFEDCLERALFAVVTELDALHVVRGGAEAFCFLHHLVRRDENELGTFVDEFLDQPRAGDAIDLNSFTCDPLHAGPPAVTCTFKRADVSATLSSRRQLPPAMAFCSTSESLACCMAWAS